MNRHAQLLEALTKSPTFRDYQRAFSEATGLPLALRPLESWQPALRGAQKESPFCAMIVSQSRTCAGCLQTQEELCQSAVREPRTLTCQFGLTEMAVPVKLGNETIAFLVSGQVLRGAAGETEVDRAFTRLEALGLAPDRDKVREALLQTRVVSGTVIESATRLLAIFAEHLSLVSNQIVLQQANSEPPLVTRVKDFVRTRYEEDITLADAARAASTSTFHLCKVFKKATGMCFTEFVSRTRVEKAKEMLLRPNLRVSEVAYEVGFQSLTHFNRIFKKLVGESPTEYRATLPLAA
jgi:AraC-like DNA-binding protein